MKKGEIVKFIGCEDTQVRWGSNDDPNGILIEGEFYTLEDVEVHSWHTKVQIKGIKGKFNSVCFE